MNKRKLRFLAMMAIILIISVTIALFFKVYAQRGPIFKKKEMAGMYLDKESIKYEKNRERGMNIYTENWYSIDPKTYHEKSGINIKTGKLNNVDCYYVRFVLIDWKNKNSANAQIDRCLNNFTAVGRGRWKEGSYLGNVYGERTICFKIKNKAPEGYNSIKFLTGKKVVEITVGGEVNKKYLPVEFIEKIAGIVESRL